MKLIELSEVEILIMKSIWKLGDGITVYEIIDYLDQVYDRKYARSTVKTYITKLKKKGFVDTQVKGNYSYITAKITEKMYREEQMELMKDFWHDGSVKELVQTLTHTISKEEKEAIKAEIKDGLEGLAGQIPGLLEIHVNTNGLESSNADLMLDSTFTDEAALKGYSVHPAHVAVANGKVRPHTAIRSCLDFTV